jgi:hypothetical protein
MDNSFDQLGPMQVRHRLVAPFKLGTAQAVTLLQRRNEYRACDNGWSRDQLVRGHRTNCG